MNAENMTVDQILVELTAFDNSLKKTINSDTLCDYTRHIDKNTILRFNGRVPRPKQGRNNASIALATAVHTADGKTIFQKEIYRNRNIERKRVRQDLALARLMNCKTVDKFDVPTKEERRNRPKTQKPTPNVCPWLKRDSVRALIMAGSEIHVDPWKHERKVVYKGYLKGQCGFDDIAALVRDGLIQKVSLPNGYFKYVHTNG